MTNTRYTPEAMRERAVAARDRMLERINRLYRPVVIFRFDGSEVLCPTFADHEREAARYEKDSGGFTLRSYRMPTPE
ncbi:MAG TPA: hypothetical protein VJP77_05900, partial [Planctomycetota bacterium]|nr:hypothetical protein [Planctomycetota bacterium]